MSEIQGVYYKYAINYDNSGAEQLKRDIKTINALVQGMSGGSGSDFSAFKDGARNIRSLANAFGRLDGRSGDAAVGRIRREAKAVSALSSAYREAARSAAGFLQIHSRVTGNSVSQYSRMMQSMRKFSQQSSHDFERQRRGLFGVGAGARSATRALGFMQSTLGALGIPLASFLGVGGAAAGGISAVMSRSEQIRNIVNSSALLGVSPQQQRSTDLQFRAMGADEGAGTSALRNIRNMQAEFSRGQIDPGLASSFAIAGLPSLASFIKRGQNPADALEEFRTAGRRAYQNAGNNETQKQNVVNAMAPIFGDATAQILTRPQSEWDNAKRRADSDTQIDKDQIDAQRQLNEATAHLSRSFESVQAQLLKDFGPALAHVIDSIADKVPGFSDSFLHPDNNIKGAAQAVDRMQYMRDLQEMLESGEKRPYDENLKKQYQDIIDRASKDPEWASKNALKIGNAQASMPQFKRNKDLNDAYDAIAKLHPEAIGGGNSWSNRFRAWAWGGGHSTLPGAKAEENEFRSRVNHGETADKTRQQMLDDYNAAGKSGDMESFNIKWLGATPSASPNPSLQVSPGLSREDMHRASIYKESRGQDFDSNGNPTKSADGAMFSRQVLPKVAFDPSLKTRFGIDPARDTSAPEFNRVGDQLLDALYDKYGGDAQKAMAAYHSGEGNVDRALRLSKATGKDWQGALGPAGRGYIDYRGEAWNPSDYDNGNYAPPPAPQQDRTSAMSSPTFNVEFHGVSGRDADMIENRMRNIIDSYSAHQNMNAGAQYIS